jgi:hypothetical protein
VLLVRCQFSFHGREGGPQRSRDFGPLLFDSERSSGDGKHNLDLIVSAVVVRAVSNGDSSVRNLVRIPFKLAEFSFDEITPTLPNFHIPSLDVELHSTSCKDKCRRTSFVETRFTSPYS